MCSSSVCPVPPQCWPRYTHTHVHTHTHTHTRTHTTMRSDVHYEMMFSCTMGPETLESNNYGLKPLKLWATINLSSFISLVFCHSHISRVTTNLNCLDHFGKQFGMFQHGWKMCILLHIYTGKTKGNIKIFLVHSPFLQRAISQLA
jgi:hypothetical protein